VLLIEIVILGAFIAWLVYMFPTLDPDNYLFYGDAPHEPYLEQYIDHTAVTVIRWFFYVFTAVMMLSMMFTILGELIRWWLNHGRKGEPYNALPGSPKEEQVERFRNPFKLWHYLVMIGMTLAGIIGLLQAFPDWGPGQSFFNAIGLDTARNFHHYFAYLVDFTIVYFIIYFFYQIIIKKRRMFSMLPTLKDIRDAIDMNLYILGLKENEPQYSRFTFGQKIDFFLVLIGAPTLTVTGLAMHYTQFSEPVIGGLGIAICVVIHRNVALFLAWLIISVHIYYAHLAPGFFPMNPVILTGKMPVSRYRVLYPLDSEPVIMKQLEKTVEKIKSGEVVTGNE